MMSSKAAYGIRSCTTTLTPFLYQTRTLRNFRSIGVGQNRKRKVQQLRQFTFSTPCRVEREFDGKVMPSPETRSWSPLQSISESHDSKPAQESHDDLPRSPTVEEVTTSTLNVDPATRADNFLNGFNSDSHLDHTYEEIDFDGDMDKDAFVTKDEIAELTRSRPLGESTITDSERYAFQKVFRDIFGKSQGGNIGVSDVFDASSASGKSTPVEGVNAAAGSRTMSRSEMEEMVSRYPAPLRGAAARAIGLMEVEVDADDEVHDSKAELDLARLEALREPERRRVETLMQNAKTDFELWDVMEKEVFSLIPRLGLKDIKPETPKKKKTKRKTAKVAEAEVKESTESSTHLQSFITNEEGISPLALYGPLYPSFLLLGLRLLDRSFAKSSSLTLTLLPKIKSLGLISHVLGASSQLYNELLRIHRYRHDDYRGVLMLLEEMEHSGIEFDKDTLDIVRDIQRTQLSVRRGEKGAVLQALWSLPEFAPNKFKLWYDKIGGDINAREMTRQSSLRY